MAGVEAEQVVQHQHLAVATGAGADADGRDRAGGGDLRGQCGRHAFQHQQGGAGFGHGERILAQPGGGGILAALHLEAAEAVHRLRGQAQMAANGDFALDQVADRVQLVAGAFQLDHARAGLDEAHRGGVRFERRAVGTEREIGDLQRALRAAGDRSGVVDDVVDAHGQGRIVALHHHAQRIADQDQVAAVVVQHAGEAGVVAGQHHQLAAFGARLREHRHRPGFLRLAHAWFLPAGRLR